MLNLLIISLGIFFIIFGAVDLYCYEKAVDRHGALMPRFGFIPMCIPGSGIWALWYLGKEKS